MPRFIVCYSFVDDDFPGDVDEFMEWNCCVCGADALVEAHAFIVFMLNHEQGTHLICTGCNLRRARAWLN